MLERKITATDLASLDSYEYKCKEVRAFALACISGTQTGLLLFGAGGNGKSYSIRETFKERHLKQIQPEDKAEYVEDDEVKSEFGADDEVKTEYEKPKKEYGYDSWVEHQGRITPKGLVKAMAMFPQSIHLVEDAETIFDDKNCWGVLRMALHSQDHSLHSQRHVTWTVSTRDSYDFLFTGALVIVGNRVLAEGQQEIEAVKTRCPCLNFDISNRELIAKMKWLCEQGYTGIPTVPLSRDDCYDVLEFLLTAIAENPELKRDAKGHEKKLNFRILISGFRFLALSRMEPAIHWRDMLLSQLKQVVGAAHRTRKERIHDEVQIAREITAKKWPSQHDKLVEWCNLTGRSIDWSQCGHGTPEYRKGFQSAKTDLSRKNK